MDYKINLGYLIEYIADFRYLLFEHLSATEVATVAAIVKFELNSSEKAKWLNPRRDLGFFDDVLWTTAKHLSVHLVGHEVEQLRRRISSPLKWWKDGLGDMIPSVWLSVDWMPSSSGIDFDLGTLKPSKKEKSIMDLFRQHKYQISPKGSDNFTIIQGNGRHKIKLCMSPKNVALNTMNLVDMGVLTRNGRAEHVITPTQSVCLSNGRYSPVLPFELVDKLGLFVVVQDLASIGYNTEQ
ncbi:hypothetical protein F5B18DRAFT_638696 [Nemania serpens]|nr:hypothetical protein F5B18DRAFT_638696 [Nemania serpens]